MFFVSDQDETKKKMHHDASIYHWAKRQNGTKTKRAWTATSLHPALRPSSPWISTVFFRCFVFLLAVFVPTLWHHEPNNSKDGFKGYSSFAKTSKLEDKSKDSKECVEPECQSSRDFTARSAANFQLWVSETYSQPNWPKKRHPLVAHNELLKVTVHRQPQKSGHGFWRDARRQATWCPAARGISHSPLGPTRCWWTCESQFASSPGRCRPVLEPVFFLFFFSKLWTKPENLRAAK